MSRPLPQSSCSLPSVSTMGVSSHSPTRRWDLSNPQITHVSHFSKSLKINRAHKNKPAPAIHPLNLTKPCDVLRTHVSAAGQTSGGKELEQTNGDIERIYSASQTHYNCQDDWHVQPPCLQVFFEVPSPLHLAHIYKTSKNHSSITWRIPWTEEPGRLPTMQSQRVEHG